MTTEERLKELSDDLRDIRDGVTGETYAGFGHAENALDLAIKIAEAVAANPRGFLNWMKVTGGGEL